MYICMYIYLGEDGLDLLCLLGSSLRHCPSVGYLCLCLCECLCRWGCGVALHLHVLAVRLDACRTPSYSYYGIIIIIIIYYYS